MVLLNNNDAGYKVEYIFCFVAFLYSNKIIEKTVYIGNLD